MSDKLRGAELDALDYLWGGGDEEIVCRSVVWVVTRYPHQCMSILHKGTAVLPAGTRMVLERARVDGQFGSCYTCESCIEKCKKELAE